MEKIKSATYSVKEDATEGEFTALVAVFGNVDKQGDIIDPGAFTDTLAEWKSKGQPIPIIWDHQWTDLFAHIGGVTDAQETETGLQITGQLDMNNPSAVQAYALLKSGRVNQFSFTARAAEGGWSLESLDDGTVVNHLTKLDLIEVGPTLRGANPETQLISIKSATDALNPSGLAAADIDTIKSIHEHLGEVITLAERTSPPELGREETKASETPGPFVLPAIRAKAIASLVGEES